MISFTVLVEFGSIDFVLFRNRKEKTSHRKIGREVKPESNYKAVKILHFMHFLKVVYNICTSAS